MANTVRVRKDVLNLADWDPILLWYARAVAQMQQRPIADPTSWRYQAAIHEYRPGNADPLSNPADVLPSAADQKKFWNQCQHFSWYFLPWHRMYLACFEQIVAATVVSLGGPADWALPYWNYSNGNNARARQLPVAFRDQLTPDGLPNPLRVDHRDAGNDGSTFLDDLDVDLKNCLKEPLFTRQAFGGIAGFGGPKTTFHHIGGSMGEVDRVPHGAVHVAIGDWMGGFNTAGLDPIFWVHHANIDRLWEVWRGRNVQPPHVDPTDGAWLTGETFNFHDASGTPVTFTSDQVVTTTADRLGYRYEDVSDPLPVAAPGLVAAVEVAMEDQTIPELVGATEEPIVLTGQPAAVRVAVSAPTGPAASPEAVAAPPNVYLNFENITAEGAPTSYAVYLNVPEGEDPRNHPELLAGILPMFGAAESSATDQDHAGSGLHYALDVSDLVRSLEASGQDTSDLQVQLVPRHRPGAADVAEAAAVSSPPIRVGRVSVYRG